MIRAQRGQPNNNDEGGPRWMLLRMACSTGQKKVVLASSLGTVFEWYDFYLYGSLAAIIAKQFFSG